MHLLHWQVDSLPLSHKGIPTYVVYINPIVSIISLHVNDLNIKLKDRDCHNGLKTLLWIKHQRMEENILVKKMWCVCIYTHTHTHTYVQWTTSHKKNKTLPFAATWMDQENIILTEVSQTAKDKHYMISLILVF